MSGRTRAASLSRSCRQTCQAGPAAQGVAYLHERVGVRRPEVLITALVHGNDIPGALAL